MVKKETRKEKDERVPLLPHKHIPGPVNNAPNVADTELKYISLDMTLTSSFFGTLAGVLQQK